MHLPMTLHRARSQTRQNRRENGIPGCLVTISPHRRKATKFSGRYASVDGAAGCQSRNSLTLVPPFPAPPHPDTRLLSCQERPDADIAELDLHRQPAVDLEANGPGPGVFRIGILR